MDTLTVSGCERAHYEPLTRIVRLVRPGVRPKVKMQVEGLKASVFFSCVQRAGAGKFVYDMMARWLLPTRRVSIGLFFATDFEYDEALWTAGELSFMLNSSSEVKAAKQSFKRLVQELELGLSSAYFAERILELKGLSGEEKLACVQNRLALLSNRFLLSDDALITLQQFSTQMPRVQVQERSVASLTRLVLHMHRLLKSGGVRLLPQLLDTPVGMRYSLAVVISKKKSELEVFDKSHALRAIKSVFPKTEEVLGCSVQIGDLIYFEIEKKSGASFSPKEILSAQELLPEAVEEATMRLVHPIAMVRNEEEVMRNLIALSKEVKFVSDPPQVMISFEAQEEKTLVFTVLVVGLEELDVSGFVLERVREMDQLRGRVKYAHVMRCVLLSEPFLSDRIDMFAARKEVVRLLEEEIGVFRDFNGGILEQEQRNLEELCNLCPKKSKKEVEAFFYGLSPATLRVVLPPELLKQRLTQS